MTTRIAIFVLGTFSLAFLSCDEMNAPSKAMEESAGDLVRRVEVVDRALECRTNEPFASIGFNHFGDGTSAEPYGDGRILYRYPDNTPPDFVGEETLTRIGGGVEIAAGVTKFTLSNGLSGKLEETQCVDDMSGLPASYKITIENWGDGATPNSPPKTGCCWVKKPEQPK